MSGRRARLLCLPAAYAVFFAGLAVSGVYYFQSRAFDLKAAVISDLISPEDNPRGFGAGAAGAALCGLLLAPVALGFYRRLRTVRTGMARAGALLLGAGLAAATAIGVLAPSTRGYTPVHIQLAYAAFIGICAGTTLLLTVAGGRLARAMAALNGAVLAFLLFLYFGPEIFDNNHLLTSLAFCEWLLCLDCAAALWVLDVSVKALPRKTAAAGA